MKAKLRLQWKDPDFYDGVIPPDASDEEVDEYWALFKAVGIDEYLMVEIDTETKTVRIVGGKQ